MFPEFDIAAASLWRWGPPELSSDEGGPVQLAVESDPGRSFALEATSNLVQWTEIARGTNTSETFQFFDWSVTKHPLRFYRTVTP